MKSKDKLKVAKDLKPKCTEVSSLLKSLSHPGRLMIMGNLVDGGKTVTELQRLCDLSQSQLSQFLARMRLEGLVQCQREGRFQFYSAASPEVSELIRSIQRIFCHPPEK
jgi:ArsR family transcriptional regulator